MLEKPDPWTGPVVRRDPSTYQQPSEVRVSRCTNPHCLHWLTADARRRGACQSCRTPTQQTVG